MKAQKNFRISDHTQRQLNLLTSRMNTTETDVISTAIDRMAREERTNMSSLTIGTIDTRPEPDPFKAGSPTRTVISLDPDTRTIDVCQRYHENSWPSDEWHGVIRTWYTEDHPTEDDMREWIESHTQDFLAICDGHETVWDGSNHVGRMTEDAHSISEKIDKELNESTLSPWRNYGYAIWDSFDWYEAIRTNYDWASYNDEALAKLADEMDDDGTNNDGYTIILDTPVLDVFRQYREEAIAEADDD